MFELIDSNQSPQGCYIDLTLLKGSLLPTKNDVHTRFKHNLVNFEIPNGFLYYENDFGSQH